MAPPAKNAGADLARQAKRSQHQALPYAVSPLAYSS
jgi:hypothetical protein